MSEEDAIVPEGEEAAKVEADAETKEVTETGSEEQAPQEKEPSESSAENKEKDKVQERIDELTKQFRDQERETAHWKAQATKQPAVESEITLDVKTLADFEYDETAYQKHVTEQATARAEKVVAASRQTETQSAKRSEFSSREQEFAKDKDDYYRVTGNDTLPINDNMAAFLMDSEKGPELYYHLGENPRVADNIAAMPPIQMAREMIKIEQNLATKPDSKASKAPEPAPKIKAVEQTTAKKIDDPNLSDADFAKLRRKQIANR